MTIDRPLKLLIGNDDGVFALGIRTLANTLARSSHQVTVVCPDRERSATGHGLTLHQPIRAEQIQGIFDPEVIAWSCSGTPSDCIKLALSAILTEPPDFVLSGINHGPNLGTDILYSGTVSAAMEGTIEGISSIAFSLGSYTSKEFQVAAEFACKLLHQLQQQSSYTNTLLNVNIPAVSQESIKGVKITRQGVRKYIEQFQQRVDPRGKNYYWLAGEIVEDVERDDRLYLSTDIITDVRAVKENYISITPLQYNLTDAAIVDKLDRDLNF
jgi:5'-nucleotidase